MRHDLRVPDDGSAQQRSHRVPDRGHIHADYAGIPVRHFGEPSDMHHHQKRVDAEVPMELVQRMVPEQAVRRLRPDQRQHPAERVRATVAQLFARRQQNVLRLRPGERQEVHVHPGRVQDADRHVQLHGRRVHKHHGRVPVRVSQHRGAAQVQRGGPQGQAVVPRDRGAEQLHQGPVQPHTGTVQLRPAVRGHSDQEQERDRVERRPDVPDAVRHGRVPARLHGRRPGACGRRRPAASGVDRGPGRRVARVVHERHVQRARRAVGHGLRERVAAAEGRARGLRQLLAPDQPECEQRPAGDAG